VIDVTGGVNAGAAVDGSILIDSEQILPAQPVGLFGREQRADILNDPFPAPDE
jgi:hypothetical protein